MEKVFYELVIEGHLPDSQPGFLFLFPLLPFLRNYVY